MAKSPFNQMTRELMDERWTLYSKQRERFNAVREQCENIRGIGSEFLCVNGGHPMIKSGEARCNIKLCPFLNPAVRVGPHKCKVCRRPVELPR